MSSIKVNDKITVEGKFSFNVVLDDSIKPAKVVISGGFQTAEYIEEITKLENDKYVLSNVKVKHEAFGSEDKDIAYEFMAGSFVVKGAKTRRLPG